MALDFRLEGAQELTRTLGRSPRIVSEEERRAMSASLLLLESSARSLVRQDTRRLMNSITSRQRQSGNSLVGQVGPSVGYGAFVERGTIPHWPPRAPLERWARRHGVPVFVVQRAIARRGTRARPFMAPAWARNAHRVAQLFAAAGARIVARLAGGGS